MPELSFLGNFFQKGSVPSWITAVCALGALAAYVYNRIYLSGRKQMMAENLHEREGLEGVVDRLVAEVHDLQASSAAKDGRIADLERKVAETVATCAASTLRVSQLEFALRWAMDEIELHMPDSKVPAQIKSLIAASHPGSLPSGIDQATMNKLRDVE